MPSDYEIDFEEPSLSRCVDCGALSVRLTRFVTRDGDAAVPLERGYGLPDDLFGLGDDPAGRIWRDGAFASLDDNRSFVRCLLPVPVEGYDVWSIEVWVEVSRADFNEAWKVWDHPRRYRGLRFTGVLASDIATDLGLPVPQRAEVTLHVTDPKALPKVEAPATGDLAELLSRPWPPADFEAYAVARAFL